jgi:hypothetical protein
MPTEFVGDENGKTTDRPLGPEAGGADPAPGSGGPGGTEIPGSAGAGQNCAGESVGKNEYIDWPHIGGAKVGDAEWEKAKGFIPKDWIRIDCDGLALRRTRCTCTETPPVREVEVILFLYRWPVGKVGGKTKWLSDFHMIGRTACPLPQTWHSKKDKREKVKDITDPKQSLEDAYPHTKKPDREIVRLCFCASKTTTK